MRNTKPISEPISPLEEEAMTFPPPANEPPSPTYIPAFSPLEEEEEDEVKGNYNTHHHGGEDDRHSEFREHQLNMQRT